MRKFLQFALLGLGVLALVVLIADIIISVQATTHGDTAVKVQNVKAGPYDLQVRFYKYPADAGYALPFAIAPQEPVQGTLTYQVNTIPSRGVDATPIRAGLSPDPKVPNGIQGAAEVTVHGDWSLRINVAGPSGSGTVSIYLPVNAPFSIPNWLGWFIGLIPLYGLLTFLLLLRKPRVAQSAQLTESVPVTAQ